MIYSGAPIMAAGAAPGFGGELWGRRYAIVYLALVIRLGVEIGRWHDPNTGFSSLIDFGEQFAPRRLPALSSLPLYTYARSSGYDGQFYAQLAVAGNPFDPAVAVALDSPGYRARRILFPALVHLAGLGQPARILQIYALANLLCLLILALLLARWWFPPTDLHNLLRWVGTLFGAGMMVSVTRSLTDGPALLVIAIGARLVERNRRGVGAAVGAAVLGAAGLVRETSVLCAAAFAPTTAPERRVWPRAIVGAIVCVAPTFVWSALLSHHYGAGVGTHNFDLPFVSFARKVEEVWRTWRDRGFNLETRTNLWTVVALGTQIAFLLLRPRLELVWWRIGAAFAALGIFLGWSVWEGSPAAAPRALLPLTMAFNLLAPRSRRGLLLLLAGNLTVLSALDIARSVPSEQSFFQAGVTCRYQTGWQATEGLGRRTWRWASGPASLTIQNPTSSPLVANLAFGIASVTARTVTIQAPPQAQAAELSVSLAPHRRISQRYGPIVLRPGPTTLRFDSAEPPWIEPKPGGRPLTFSIHDLYLTVGQ
jgi:hypothetical protein